MIVRSETVLSVFKMYLHESSLHFEQVNGKSGQHNPAMTEPDSASQEQSQFICPFCSKMYTSDSGLQIHMRKHTGKFKFWCSQCERDFPHRTAYRDHMDKHEGITFPCQKCTKRFQTRISLKYHQSEHTGVYLYRCRFCAKGYNLKSNFKNHEDICGGR